MVFFDECVPQPLRKLLLTQNIKTAQEMGWARLKDAALISKAEEAGFKVFVTCDRDLRHQQNLRNSKIALLVLSTNYWPILRKQYRLIDSALVLIQPGQCIELTIPTGE